MDFIIGLNISTRPFSMRQLVKTSGEKSSRSGLDRCIETLEPGDTLIVLRLDRLRRSMSHLIDLIESLIEQGIGFKSISSGGIAA